MDLDPVELAVGAGAEVVLHIARAADVFRVGRAARKLVKDHAIGLGHDIGENVQPAAVGHAVDDLAHAILPAIFNHRFERRDHAFAAIEPEPLGADVFLAEEAFVLFAPDHGGEDRLLAVFGEFDVRAGAFHPVLEKAAFIDIGDVHVFKADLAAIIVAQDVDQLAHAGPLQAQRAAHEHLAIERIAGESVIFRRHVGRKLALVQAERIEIGGKVAAHAIGADQHHRPDRIRGCLLHRRRAHCCAGFRCRLPDRHLHGGGIHRLGQVILEHAADLRPAGALPAWPGLRTGLVAGHIAVGAVGKEFVALTAHRNHLSAPESIPTNPRNDSGEWLFR